MSKENLLANFSMVKTFPFSGPSVILLAIFGTVLNELLFTALKVIVENPCECVGLMFFLFFWFYWSKLIFFIKK